MLVESSRGYRGAPIEVDEFDRYRREIGGRNVTILLGDEDAVEVRKARLWIIRLSYRRRISDRVMAPSPVDERPPGGFRNEPSMPI